MHNPRPGREEARNANVRAKNVLKCLFASFSQREDEQMCDPVPRGFEEVAIWNGEPFSHFVRQQCLQEHRYPIPLQPVLLLVLRLPCNRGYANSSAILRRILAVATQRRCRPLEMAGTRICARHPVFAFLVRSSGFGPTHQIVGAFVVEARVREQAA